MLPEHPGGRIEELEDRPRTVDAMDRKTSSRSGFKFLRRFSHYAVEPPARAYRTELTTKRDTASRRRTNQEELIKSVLKKCIVPAVLLVSIGAAVPAYAQPSCTPNSGAGRWAFTETGTIILPTGSILFGAVGVVSVDAAGNVSGTSVSSTGIASSGTLSGVLIVNPDCSFTVATAVYDAAGTLQRYLDFAGVFTSKSDGLHAIVTSLRLPNGTPLPSVITLNAERQQPGPGSER